MTLKDVVTRLIALLRRYIHVEDMRGDPLVIAGRKLIPSSRSVRIGSVRKAGGGGFIWNRPTAITEEIGEGIYRHYSVHDETLRTVIGILAGAVIFRLALAILVRRK